MIKRLQRIKRLHSGLLALGLLVLAGCGTEATVVPPTPAPTATIGDVVTPPPTPTTGTGAPAPVGTTGPATLPSPVSTAYVTPTLAPGGTPTAGGPTPTNGASAMQIQVTKFTVWQNFMPGPGSGKPPLLASVDLNITNNGPTAISQVLAPYIQIQRPTGGDVLLTGPMQGGDMGMGPGPAAGLPPGASSHFTFTANPTELSLQLTENEPVIGRLTLKFDGQERTIDLPTTQVAFVH